MAYDYTDAPEQWSDGPIPDGTIATLQLTIRPGGAGEDGLLKRSQDGGCEMLDCEFVLIDGLNAKRKFWEWMVLNGTTDGHAKAAEISRGKLRAILESARGIKPSDMSKEAREARKAELGDFDGMRFIARIGIEKGRPKNDGSGENYADRNTITSVVTPDRKGWHAVEQVPRPARPVTSEAAAVVVPISKPAWAS
jgi:hypothetical protein